MTALERPAGRPACGARPAGARHRRTGRAEYERLRAAGVSHDAAAVLAWPPALGAAEIEYWRALQYEQDPADRTWEGRRSTDTSRRTA